MIDANPYFHEMSDWQAVGFNDVWQSCTNFWLFQLHQTGLLQHTTRFTIDSSCIVNWNFYDPAWSTEEKLVSLAEQSFWVDYDTTLGPSPRWLGWVPECDADTPPSKQQELKAMTLIACHFKHVTYDSSFALKRSPWLFPRPARNFQIARTAKTWSGSWRSCWTTTLQVFQNLAPMMIMMELVQMHISCARPSRRGVFFVACSGESFSRWRLAFSRKPSGGIFGGLPSTMQELEPIWWRRVVFLEMLETHRPPYFRWIWPYYVPCCVPCWFGQGCYKVIYKMPELREVSTSDPPQNNNMWTFKNWMLGRWNLRINSMIFWGFFHSICAVAPAVTAYQWHWWDAAVQGGFAKIASFLGGSRRDVSSPHGYGCQENHQWEELPFFLQKNVFECPKLSGKSWRTATSQSLPPDFGPPKSQQSAVRAICVPMSCGHTSFLWMETTWSQRC